MEIRILKRYYYQPGRYQGMHIFYLDMSWFKFHWFTDMGEWFIYIYIRGSFYRFGSAGYVKGKWNK